MLIRKVKGKTEYQARAVPLSNPPLEPFMASSIFRRAFDDGSAQRENVSRPAGISTSAREWDHGRLEVGG